MTVVSLHVANQEVSKTNPFHAAAMPVENPDKQYFALFNSAGTGTAISIIVPAPGPGRRLVVTNLLSTGHGAATSAANVRLISSGVVSWMGRLRSEDLTSVSLGSDALHLVMQENASASFEWTSAATNMSPSVSISGYSESV